MKGIVVAAGATLDGGVASPEYHELLAHYYIPNSTAQIGMDFVMQEDGAPSHSSAMTRNWRSDAANWPPTATLFTPGFSANSADLNPLDYHVWAAWHNEVNKVLKERLAGHAKNEMKLKAAVYTAWTQVDQNAVKRSIASWPKRFLMCIEKEGGSFEYVSTTPQMTCFRGAKVCRKWLREK